MRVQTLEKCVGASLMLGIGAIHLLTAPDQFNDATYKGALFLANAAAAGVIAIGIWRWERWGWLLGLALAAATLTGYAWSRTLGLPGLPPDPNIFEPLGVVAVACELGFVALAFHTQLPRHLTGEIEREQEARQAA